ncbi:MAG: ACP S-malonyltransferase, partial [bacterium]
MRVKTAVLFPGQGSQSVGMASGFYASQPQAKALLDGVDSALGRGLLEFMFQGPEDVLKDTANTQPALYAAGLASWAGLQAAGFKADGFAGHSLGEYCALQAAGAFSFIDGLKLVQARAVAMAAAAKAAPGSMAAVLKLGDADVEAVCREASVAGAVGAANYNCPGQVVISGSPEGLAKAAELVKAKGGRCLPLAVSGAFHSPVMRPAGETLRAAFGALAWSVPQTLVLANVDASPHQGTASIQDKLVAQVSGPVRWTQTIQAFQGLGFSRFVEVGPGKVLAGLVKKIAPEAQVFSVG